MRFAKALGLVLLFWPFGVWAQSASPGSFSNLHGHSASAARSLSVLQLGDSHTAADFFTGELRRLLQERYGVGAPGYLPPGRPHPGVASAQFSVSTSGGWQYRDIRLERETESFFLSGYTATAHAAGETMSYMARPGNNYAFRAVDVEAIAGPGMGAVDIQVDLAPPVHVDLESPLRKHVVIRLRPPEGRVPTMKRLVITTSDSRPVILGGIGIVNNRRGATLTSYGYPGATVEALDRFTTKAFADGLRQINPQVVILAFGTNDGFNDNLNLANWSGRFRLALQRIREALPRAAIVLIGPPDGNRKTPKKREGGREGGREGAMACASAQGWSTPPRLDDVRKTIRSLAAEGGYGYWDWSSVSPGPCGADALVHSSPPLMAADHVHFTPNGYRMSAGRFLRYLVEIIDR